jgi:hypothetical protein
MHTLGDWRRNLPAKLAEATAKVNAAAGRVVLGGWTPSVHDGVLGLHRGQVFYEITRLDLSLRSLISQAGGKDGDAGLSEGLR